MLAACTDREPVDTAPPPLESPLPADVVAAFEEFDTNRSGKLDHAELRAALKSMGFETSQQQVRSSQTLRSYLLLPTYHGHSCCGHTFH